MEWYLKVLRKYAVFTGRARRTEYWMFFLFNMIISFLLGLLDGVLIATSDTVIGFLGLLYSLAVLLPGIAVSVRRLHDVGKSGWMLLVGLIPIIGTIWLIVLFATEGDRGANAYGPDPKALSADYL